MFFNLYFCCVLFTSFLFVSAQVGDSCTIKSTGGPGVCKISSDCPEAEEKAKNGITPTICGFHQLTIPILCCKENIYSSQPNGLDVSSFLYPTDEPENNPRPTNTQQRKRISETKCVEYSKYVTETVQAIPLVTHSEPISISVEKCDYNSVALIVGGKPAGAGEFPFMAAVGFVDDREISWRCGGTLISEKFVLTAAHCTFSRDFGDPKVVRLGDLDLNRIDDGSQHQDYDILDIKAHPNYTHYEQYYDIALLELAERVKFTQFIRPACLQQQRNIEQSVAVATGYGVLNFGGDNANKLMKVSLHLYENTVCSKIFHKSNKLNKGILNNMLCAGELEGGKDTCQGDSGGPLLVTQRGNQCKFYVVGVTSFGKACGEKNTAAVYTRVSDFVDWIENIAWR